MKPTTNWYKIGVWVAAAIILVLITRSCGTGGNTFFGCNHSDTVRIKRDSIITVVQDSLIYTPVPYKVEKPVPYAVHDTLPGQIVIQSVDTAAILKQFYEIALYDTTIKLKRSLVRIIDTVTQNRIAARKVLTETADTVITTTITITQPKKMILYFDASIFGNRTYGLNGFGTGLFLKGKNDLIYGIGVNWITHTKPEYSFKASLPIRLTKNR